MPQTNNALSTLLTIFAALITLVVGWWMLDFLKEIPCRVYRRLARAHQDTAHKTVWATEPIAQAEPDITYMRAEIDVILARIEKENGLVEWML